MAWQQYVADVGLEIDPSTGRFAYKEIVVSVMRQNGKTTLVLAAEVARCLLWGLEQRVAYSAQTGNAARQKFKEDQKPLIEKNLSPLVERFYMSDGNTSLVWKNGSRINVLDTTPTAGHGKTLDLAVIDEAFADKDSMREQALLPTMATRPDAQLWNVSTAGTPASTYLARKVEVGRAAVREDRRDGVAFFEWAIPVEDDVDDPAVWAERMPAFGVTIHEDYIKHARQTMPDGEFRRAIGNQWTETDERIIPAEWWVAVCAHDVRVGEPVMFAIDARPDRSSAAVVKADGSGNVEVVAVRDGVNWLPEVFLDKVSKTTPILLDKYGPAAVVGDDLTKAGFGVVWLDSLETRKSCARFFDGVADGKIRVRTDERFDEAVKHAARKTTSDAWVWHRESPGGELLMAASIVYAQAVTDEAVFPPFAWG